MTNKKPHRETGLQVRDVWYSESDPGETRTHDQWLKSTMVGSHITLNICS
jgi:hypothetical protein